MIRDEKMTEKSLRKRMMESGPLSLQEASRIFDKLAEVVDSTHLQGALTHAAITPERVMLLPDGGVSLKLDDSTSTSGYFSPESAWQVAPTHATAIWSLGALLYEMLTGVVPLPAVHPSALAQPGARWGARKLPGEAAAAQAIVDRALMRAPECRYESAQEMANELWEVVPQGNRRLFPTRISSGSAMPAAAPRKMSAMQRMLQSVSARRPSL